MRKDVVAARFREFIAQEKWRVNDFERTREDFNRLTCTGPAGTVVIADTRGLHRGSMLDKGHRLQIFSQYRMNMVCEYT